MSDIRINQRIIGTITLNEKEVHGEGGSHDARVVFPLTVMMHPQPTGAMLVLTELRCSLHLAIPAFEGNRVGQMAIVHLLEGMTCRSATNDPMTGRIEVRIPLTEQLFAYLETHRHQHPERSFVAYLGLHATIAWLSATGNVTPPEIPDHSIDRYSGPFSILAPFWYPSIGEIPMQIPASVWIGQVIEPLKFSSSRLVELTLPEVNNLLPDSLLSVFDTAQRDYDLGNYRECIQKCRDVRNLVEHHLGATRQQPVATIIGDRLGLAPSAPQRAFLSNVWTGFADLTNAAHHLSTVQGMLRADAHACLLTVALLLAYISQLR